MTLFHNEYTGDFSPESTITMEKTKKLCSDFAKGHYAKTKSFIGTLGSCLDNSNFSGLSEDQINEIVLDAIEEVKEKQSGIYNQ